MRTFAAVTLALVSAAFALSASSVLQLTGLELNSFGDREALVMRTTSGVRLPSGYKLDVQQGTVELQLRGTGTDVDPPGGLQLVREVRLDTSDPQWLKVQLILSAPALASQEHLRLTQPSPHVILLEIFEPAKAKDSAPLLDLVNLDVKEPGAMTPPAAEAKATGTPARPDPSDPDLASRLGIPTVDLSQADPQRVLSLAAATGLLTVNGPIAIGTEGRGEVSMRQAGPSLASWAGDTPPSELYLSGTSDQISKFMQACGLDGVGRQPRFAAYWAASRQDTGVRPLKAGGRTSAGRKAYKEVPGGLARADELPGGMRLSDIRVTLPAMDGRDLYEVLDYLSQISGVSLMIDPYAFDLPTGSRRDPLTPQPRGGGEALPGFRPGSVFDPQAGSPGTVIGNFVNVPLDEALALILETHELEFMVYGGGSEVSGGGTSRNSSGDPYAKPMILVTSKERLNQEIDGASSIGLYQFHYADPAQVTQMLGNLDLLPGTDSGWFVYDGGARGGNGGRGGLGGGNGGRSSGSGGGSGGSGGGGIGGGGFNGGFLATAKSGLLVYRGASREPVLERVIQAVDRGAKMVHVILTPETTGRYVTAASLP